MAMLRQFNAIVFDTVREARAQKVFVGVAISTTLSALLLMWYVQPLASRAPSSRLTAMSRIDPRYLDASFAAHTVYSSAASMLFWVQILLAMTMTASMLVPLLSPRRNFGAAVTPIPRSLILLGRYVGAITPACLGVALAFGAVWVAASLKLGVWHGRFLWGAAVTALAVAASAALTALLQLVAKSHAIAVLAMVGVGLLNVAAQSPEHIRRMTGSEWAGRCDLRLRRGGAPLLGDVGMDAGICRHRRHRPQLCLVGQRRRDGRISLACVPAIFAHRVLMVESKQCVRVRLAGAGISGLTGR